MSNQWREWIPGVRLLPLNRIDDNRGWFLKVAMAKNLGTAGASFGEIYLTAATPGQSKGGHYHLQTWEWFLVVSGTARLVATPGDGGPAAAIELIAKVPMLIEVQPSVRHLFQNIGNDEMIVLSYSNRPYSTENPDTFPASLA